MFLNLLRFLLLILVFDSTLSKNPKPHKNLNSVEDPNLGNIYEELEEHELRPEDPNHPNGKSVEGYSNLEETKQEAEFLTLEDSIDNSVELEPNPIISNSERNEKFNLVSTGKDHLGEDFLCNSSSSKNRFAKNYILSPCNPTRKDPHEYETNLTPKHEIDPLVGNENVISNGSIIESDLGDRYSKSKKGNIYIERSTNFMNGTVEKSESKFFKNHPSIKPLVNAFEKFLSRKKKPFGKSSLESSASSGPLSEGRIPQKHHGSHKWNRPMKETIKSESTHHDSSKKKISRIDKLVINQQSKITKTIKTRGGKKNIESGRKQDDPSTSKVGPKTVISSETTLLGNDTSSKDTHITVITAVKEHDAKEKDRHNSSESNTTKTVKGDRENSNKIPDTTTKGQSKSRPVHISGKDKNDINTHQDGNFKTKVLQGSKGVSHTRKNKLTEPPIKHLTVQHEVKLSRNERIPEEDRGYSRKVSNILKENPWNSRLNHDLGKYEAETNDNNAGNFPILNLENSRDVSRAKEDKPENGEPSTKHHLVHNKEKLSEKSDGDTKENSHHKIKEDKHKVGEPSNKHHLVHNDEKLSKKSDGDTKGNSHHKIKEDKHEDGEPSNKHHFGHNKEKLSKKSDGDTKGNSHHKIKVLSKNPVDVKLGYVQKNDGADTNAHKERKLPIAPDFRGSKGTFHAEEKNPQESFQSAVELPNNEQIPEYDKATSPTHLETTSESLSESLKVLFYNQSLYQEVLHLVKTDRNVQAYVFNVLLLYVPVLICDVLLWLVIFKLLRHIHRQFVSNRLHSSPEPEKQETETEENSSPRETSCPNQGNKETNDNNMNSENNAQSGDVWYPPK